MAISAADIVLVKVLDQNNAFASAAMVAAYTDADEWLDEVLDYVQENLALLREALRAIPGVELIEPEGTFLAWLDFRGLGLEPEALTTFLRERACWAITRGQSFGPQGAGFGRLNIACTRAKLAAALRQLEDAVATLA